MEAVLVKNFGSPVGRGKVSKGEEDVIVGGVCGSEIS